MWCMLSFYHTVPFYSETMVKWSFHYFVGLFGHALCVWILCNAFVFITWYWLASNSFKCHAVPKKTKQKKKCLKTSILYCLVDDTRFKARKCVNLLDSPLWHIQWSQKVFGHLSYLKCVDLFGLYNKTSNQVTFENTVFRTSLSFFVWFLVSFCYLLTKVTWFDNLQTNAMASIYFVVWLKCPNTSLGHCMWKIPKLFYNF